MSSVTEVLATLTLKPPRLRERHSLVSLLAAAILLASIVYAAYAIRMIPWSNYQLVYRNAVKLGIDPVIAKYSFIYANDPWIEYWLAKYLHEHGIGSWTTLTRSNPATHIFWYPWGRDFTKTEYPLLPALGALGDPLNTTMLLPVYMGTLAVAAAYILLYIEYGLVAALAAALPLAFMNAAASRTFAGFAEKEGFASPLLLTSLLLLSMSLSRRSTALAAAAGAVASLIASAWGGYALAGMVIAATALLLPLAYREPREAEPGARVMLVAAVLYALIGLVLTQAKFGKASTPLLLLPAVAALLAYAWPRVYTMAEERGLLYRVPASLRGHRRLYLALFLLLVAIGAAAAPLIGIRGRILYTVAWPLRLAGLVKVPRIQETVAEMTGITNPRILAQLFCDTTMLFILTPLAALYGLYRVFAKGDVRLLPLVVAGGSLYYGVLGMVYLEQSYAITSAVMVAAVTATMLAPLALRYEAPSTKARSGRRRGHNAGDITNIIVLLGAVFFILILVGVAVAADATVDGSGVCRRLGVGGMGLRYRVATVTGFSPNAESFGWLYLLQNLTHMSNDTVVVTWWDYGYWISVGSGKPTLADGATINETQIRLIADFFTSNEERANEILHRFGLKPGKTLILVHDVAVLDPAHRLLIYTPSIDIPKSWAMHHIAGKDEQFNEIIRLATLAQRGQANPQELVKKIDGVLIYRMFAAAPYEFNKVGVIAPPAYEGRLNITGIDTVSLFGIAVPKYSFKHFKPYMVIFAPLIDAEGNVRVIKAQNGATLYQGIVLILYEWTG